MRTSKERTTDKPIIRGVRLDAATDTLLRQLTRRRGECVSVVIRDLIRTAGQEIPKTGARE